MGRLRTVCALLVLAAAAGEPALCAFAYRGAPPPQPRGAATAAATPPPATPTPSASPAPAEGRGLSAVANNPAVAALITGLFALSGAILAAIISMWKTFYDVQRFNMMMSATLADKGSSTWGVILDRLGSDEKHRRQLAEAISSDRDCRYKLADAVSSDETGRQRLADAVADDEKERQRISDAIGRNRQSYQRISDAISEDQLSLDRLIGAIARLDDGRQKITNAVLLENLFGRVVQDKQGVRKLLEAIHSGLANNPGLRADIVKVLADDASAPVRLAELQEQEPAPQEAESEVAQEEIEREQIELVEELMWKLRNRGNRGPHRSQGV